MAGTARRMHDEGMPFTHVFDQFWTTPACVDRMNVILREEFIRVHDIPFIEVLYSQWTAAYPDVEIKHPPKLGTLDINDVMQSESFFS